MQPQNLNPPSEHILTIKLIPDSKDYKEGMIEARLSWIASDDAHSSCKTIGMVDALYDLNFFKSRREALECDRGATLHQIVNQFKQEKQRLQEVPIILEPRPHYQLAETQMLSYQAQCKKIDEDCEKEKQLVASRFQSVIVLAEARIAEAQTRYDTAFRQWQEGEDPKEKSNLRSADKSNSIQAGYY